jgi:hypothetical protein
VEEILSELRQAGDPHRVASLKRFGAASPAFGVGLPALRSQAKRIGHNHGLALALWQTPVREARILASLIDERERVTTKQMDHWVKTFDNWEICDQVCQNLFAHTPIALAKAVEWMRRPEELVKRAGFVLVAAKRSTANTCAGHGLPVCRRRKPRRELGGARRITGASWRRDSLVRVRAAAAFDRHLVGQLWGRRPLDRRAHSVAEEDLRAQPCHIGRLSGVMSMWACDSRA